MRILVFLLIFCFELLAYKPNAEFSGYFNSLNCSLIMDKFFYINCYDYNLKGSKAVSYEVKAANLKLKQIKKRPRFEDDTSLAKKYRTTWADYKNSGYSRGHIASNASFRFSKAAQTSVFLMSNITPQNSSINENIWNEIEQRERKLALDYKSVEVLNLILYDKKPKRIKNAIAVPSFYVKIIKTPKFKECYKVPNHDVLEHSLKLYRVDCKKF